MIISKKQESIEKRAERYAEAIGISLETASWWMQVCDKIGLQPQLTKADNKRSPKDWMKMNLEKECFATDEEHISAMQEIERMVKYYKGVKKISIPMGGKAR